MNDDRVDELILAACVPRDGSHASGSLEAAQAILERAPELAAATIHTAAVVGDDAAVRLFIAADAASATAWGGPYGWDALTHLCFSRFLRLDASRSEGFLRAATALLDAGADPNTGWFDESHHPEPVRESALYGAAGVAHNESLTRLLLERGADPNDEETPYHVPESYDNAVLEALVESGKLTGDSLTTLLVRKSDWHDEAGVRYLLAHGADPNSTSRWGRTPLHQALMRDNSLAIIELLLGHGADPGVRAERLEGVGLDVSSFQIAARRGRGDALEAFRRRGFPADLPPADAFLAACAVGDGDAAREAAARVPPEPQVFRHHGGDLLARFAGVGNTDGVRTLIDLAVPVGATTTREDAYFDVALGATALHSAAWRARPETVRLLIERGAPVNARDARGRTALQLAVRACVDSYWTARRSPESVEALLRAGASPDGVLYPCGYEPVDALLRQAMSASGREDA